MADVSLDGFDAERINLSLTNPEAQTVWWALETRKRHLEAEVARTLQAGNTNSGTHYEELMFLYSQLLNTTTLMFDIRDDHAAHIVPQALTLAATGTDGEATTIMDPNDPNGTTPFRGVVNVVRKWLGVG